jgi:hypothetical protein
VQIIDHGHGGLIEGFDQVTWLGVAWFSRVCEMRHENRSNNHCAETLICSGEIYKRKKQSEKEEAAKKEKKIGGRSNQKSDVPQQNPWVL